MTDIDHFCDEKRPLNPCLHDFHLCMRGTCHIGAVDLDYLIARLKATIACNKAFRKHLKKKEMCRIVPKELKKTETSWTTTHRRGVSEPPTIVMPREELEIVFVFNIFIIFFIVNLHHMFNFNDIQRA